MNTDNLQYLSEFKRLKINNIGSLSVCHFINTDEVSSIDYEMNLDGEYILSIGFSNGYTLTILYDNEDDCNEDYTTIEETIEKYSVVESSTDEDLIDMDTTTSSSSSNVCTSSTSSSSSSSSSCTNTSTSTSGSSSSSGGNSNNEVTQEQITKLNDLIKKLEDALSSQNKDSSSGDDSGDTEEHENNRDEVNPTE